MSAIKTIGEGQTYDLITHGTFVILFGVPLGMFTSHFIAGASVLIGILLMLMSSGIQLNSSKVEIRKYRSLLGFKFGTWKNISDVKKIELRYFVEGLSGQGSNLSAPNTSRVKVFDLFFLMEDGSEHKFHTFTKLKPAFRVMKVLKGNYEIELENQVEKFYKNTSKHSNRRKT